SVALGATFFQQSMTALATMVVPIVAPAALIVLGYPAAWLGVYMAIYALAKTVFNLLLGGALRRYGGLRVSQFGLLALSLSLFSAAPGHVGLLLLSSILTAVATAIGTPAGSHILARYAATRHGPVIFSAKQTAVPVGFGLAGLLVPFLVGVVDWRG